MLFICFVVARTDLFAAGFVSMDKNDPQKFYDHLGKPLKVMGINRFAIYEHEDNKDDMSTEEYFKMLKANGFNVLRVFIREGYLKEGNRPNRSGIEPKLGTYSPEHLAEIDKVFELAKKYEIYIIFAMFDHWYLRHTWDLVIKPGDPSYLNKTAYYVPGKNMEAFYTDERNIEFAKKRITFLVNRYKDNPYLFAWEPMNEANGVTVTPYSKENPIVVKWFDTMSEVIKGIDKNHLITLSLTGDVYSEHGVFYPWEKAYSSPYADIIQIHAYGFAAGEQYIRGLLTTYFKELKKYKKAIFVGEFAPEKTNKQRAKLLRKSLALAKKNNIPMFIWTHRYDSFGEVTDEDLKIYRDTYKD